MHRGDVDSRPLDPIDRDPSDPLGTTDDGTAASFATRSVGTGYANTLPRVRPRPDEDDDFVPAPHPAPPDVDSLEVVDPEHYAIAGEFARGGLGRILEAYDRRLERPVAVKELLGSSEHAATRFVREARLTARLQHPSIVPVHEAGRWPSGRVFYAMKLVRGSTLRDEIKQARTLRERLALLPNVIAVAEAVAYAHSEGIIHRDIKPSNVLVGAFGETVVIDWGLAKDMRSTSFESLPLEPSSVDRAPVAGETAAGTVLGTPEYMSPEQAEGRPVDERADVYAIGALLYHLLSGAPPFARDSMEQVLERVIQGPPLPIEVRQPDVPEELATIVNKAMARSPSDRYPSAKELATDLRHFQTGKFVAAHQYTLWTLLIRWLKRYRAVVSVAVASLVVLAVVAGLSVDRVVDERNHAQRERAIAEARTQELTLVQARTSLDRDPTAALAWLKTYPANGPDEASLRTIAADAAARGVARHVLRVDDKAEEGAISPDGRWLAASTPNGVYLWDVARGTEVKRWERRATNKLRFTRDGGTLISIGNDGRIILHAIPPGDDRVLLGHEGAIRGSALAPNGAELATAGADGTVRVWDLARGTNRILGRHEGGAADADYSGDGRHIVSVGVDDRVRVWSVDGGPPRELTGCKQKTVVRVRFAPDGHRFALGGASGDVVIHDIIGPDRCQVLEHHEGLVIDLAFSPDGHQLASVGADGVVALYDFVAGSERRGAGAARMLHGHTDQVLAVAYSPDGRLLVTSGLDSNIRVWDPMTGDSRTLLGHSGIVNSVLFSDRGSLLASMGHDHTVRIWNLAEPGPRELRGHTSDVNAVEFSPDGRKLVSTSEDRTARVWDLATGASRVFAGHHDGVYRAQLSDDQRLLLTASWDHDLRVFDLETGASRVLHGHQNIPWRGVFTLDGAVISTSRDGTTRRWDVETGNSVVLGRHAGAVRGISFAPDRQSVATGGEDGIIEVVRFDGTERRTFEGHAGSVERLAHSPDGRLLASGGVDGTVRVWRLTGEQEGEGRTVLALGEPVKGLVFSPDGERIAVAANELVHVLDLDGRVVFTLRGHEGAIRHIMFSPDGRLLVSLGSDRTARVFDLEHGGRLRTLYRTSSYLLHGSISPDGEVFAAGGWDKMVRLWPLGRLRLPASREEMSGWLEEQTTAAIGAGSELGTP